MKQRRNKVVSTLFQRCFNLGHRHCINVVQRWKSDVGFCFIFNVGSTLLQPWSTTLKQRWSDIEILAGNSFQQKATSQMFEKFWTCSGNRFTVLHNLFSLDMSVFIDLVIKNDPVKKACGGGLTASRPSLGTRRQNFSLQSSQ